MNDQDATTGAPSVPPEDTTAAGRAVPDWREQFGLRRFGAAKQAYLAATYLAQGRLPEDAAGDDDSTRAALSALADVEELLRERRYVKAVERLSRLESRPSLAPWHALEADLGALRDAGAAIEQREPEKALAHLDSVHEDWFMAELYTLRGTAHIYLGDEAAARPLFEAAVLADPKHYRSLTNLGNLALEAGDVEGAIARYREALAVNDDFANAHHNLGVAYRRKGDVGKSVRHLRRAQRLGQRQQAATARESLSRATGGRGVNVMKWVMWAAIGAVALWLLRSQGVI